MKNKPKRLRIGIIFGGRSAEHQVSLVSAASVMKALDKKKYVLLPIGISPEGKWLSSPDALMKLKSGMGAGTSGSRILSPDPASKSLLEIKRAPRYDNAAPIDVIFPVLHGTFGEDGTIQGLFELAGIPYVGAGVLGSAAGMDKVITKQLCQQAGIPVTPYIWFLFRDFKKSPKSLVSRIEKKFIYPCFVKPANSGSSIGISKAHDRKELLSSIKTAARYDRKILIEKCIQGGREIEVSVLGNDDPVASVPGEIISSNEFYDYDAKYVDGKSRSVIPAKLPRGVAKKLRQYAVRSFKAVDCAGMARVDFLLERGSNKIVFNEINTIPGFTSISMYPKLWEASGIGYGELLDRLIELALERWREKIKFKTAFRPKKDWYKNES